MIELLENLYREHRQGLFTFALSIVNSSDLAEDAIQTAFTKMFRQLDRESMNLRNGNATAYVFRSVKNSAIDILRANARKLRLSESLFDEFSGLDSGAGPSENLINEERDGLLMKAVNSLSATDREAVVLKIFAGLTFEQAGEIAQISPKTIATRYRRALEKLENQLRGQL